jgi:hypothetical protein
MNNILNPVGAAQNIIAMFTDRAMTADLEWRLQFSQHLDCECATYMMVNRERVLPALIKASSEQSRDADDVVCQFVKNLHQRHLDGHSIFKGD